VIDLWGRPMVIKNRKTLPDLGANMIEVIDWFKRYSAHQSFSQSEIDLTIQEIMEYYYSNK
jgi:hypothetical protein